MNENQFWSCGRPWLGVLVMGVLAFGFHSQLATAVEKQTDMKEPPASLIEATAVTEGLTPQGSAPPAEERRLITKAQARHSVSAVAPLPTKVPGTKGTYVRPDGHPDGRGIPANDECAGAMAMTCGSTDSILISDGYTSGGVGSDPTSSCEIDMGGPFAHDASWWYEFTAPAGVTGVTVTMCATADNEDAVSTMFTSSSTCVSLSELACDDDFCDFPGFSPPEFAATVVPGETYLVLIDRYTGGGSTDGPYLIEFVCAAVCGDATCDAGEDCCSCPADCDPCAGCDDGICCAADGEDCDTCPTDCGACPVCGNPNAGDCCAPAQPYTPGCDDAACCEAVCLLDAYCCNVEWDNICGDRAAELPICNCPVFGACCNDDTPECTDDVLEQDCPSPLRFTANTLCEDLVPPCGEAIPTVSEWGLIVMALLVVSAGAVIVRRRMAASLPA